MKTIELTTKEVNLLQKFLSLDLDNIGFSDDEQNVLDAIAEKLQKKQIGYGK